MQDLEELDPDFIMAKQVEQLEKEKKELQERLKNQEKKVSSKVIHQCNKQPRTGQLSTNFYFSPD